MGAKSLSQTQKNSKSFIHPPKFIQNFHQNLRQNISTIKSTAKNLVKIFSSTILCFILFYFASIIHFHYFFSTPNNLHISASDAFGGSCGPVLATGCPLRSIKNFVKFHLMKSPNVPPCFIFRYFQRGCALSPFTSIFAYKSNVTPKFSFTYFLISGSGQGS